MLNEARNKSEWLGYRGSEQDWDEKFYEIEQRNLKQQQEG